MQYFKLQALFTISFIIASAQSYSGPDPCDFVNSGPLYPHDQVLNCYNSVPFNPDDLQNTVEVIGAYRERSSIREIYDQRMDWRASLQTLGSQTFANDYEFQLAVVLNHKEFDNLHFRYQRPMCYAGMLTAFVPFEFGSTLVDELGQIIFVEATPYLATEYQTATGIDVTQFIGQRVVSINGEDALEYFRQFGRTQLRLDTNDGLNLSAVLMTSDYSLRLDTRYDFTPQNAFDSYVFEDTDGNTTNIQIPWLFAPRSHFSSGDPLTSSTSEFIASCTTPGPALTLARATDKKGILEQFNKNLLSSNDQGRLEKANVVSRLMQQNSRRGTETDFYEVPPDQLGLFIDELVPWTNNARVLTLPEDGTTVIRLANFGVDWQEQVRAGTEHACSNSDQLILDLRGNGGGSSTHSTWLIRHVFPDAINPTGSRWIQSYLNKPALQELLLRSSLYTANEFSEFVCWIGFEAACYTDAASGQQMSNINDQDWALDQIRHENRAGVLEPLTRKFWFNEAINNGYNFDFTGYDPISCPGKFKDDNLILLTNGLSMSAAYFFTESMRDRVTIVTIGGYVNEPLVSGGARGGALFSQRYASDVEQALASLFGPPVDPLPQFSRDVNTDAEVGGAIYRANGIDLHVDNVPYGDIQIPLWSDSPETDGYVYRQVLGAVSESDLDNDEVPASIDNCPVNTNADQADFDGDGVGDACDPVRWYLKDVQFNDGGTATGFFDYNPSNGYSNITITTTLGSATTGFSYGDPLPVSPGNDTDLNTVPDSSMADLSNQSVLTLFWSQALLPTGGIVDYDAGFSFEGQCDSEDCINNTIIRSVISGQVFTDLIYNNGFD